MSHTVFLDESGDLGFKFTAPYLRGGSSRFLTMAFFVVPNNKQVLLKRIVRKTYEKYKFKAGTEVKGSVLTIEQKIFICQSIVNLINKNPEIFVCSISVKKQNVQEHIRRDANLLYNFMMKLSVLDKINTHSHVTLLRDNKTVKIASGNSLIDYLQTTLFFEHNSPTIITDSPQDSKKWLALILVDWLNNIVFGHYENGNSNPYQILSPILKNQTLFF
tara:strand:+ start:5958 stop:6611 length:654 start_codon:yes stop_codon:yes gene_type:complete